MISKPVLIAGALVSLPAIQPALSAINDAALSAAAVSQAGQEETAAPDPAAVAALVETFKAIIAGFPADAPQQDVEAALVFAADQSEQPEAVVLAALEQVRTEQHARVVERALTVVLAAQQRVAGYGTGAISGTEALSIFSVDTGPNVVLGGGGNSNYTD